MPSDCATRLTDDERKKFCTAVKHAALVEPHLVQFLPLRNVYTFPLRAGMQVEFNVSSGVVMTISKGGNILMPGVSKSFASEEGEVAHLLGELFRKQEKKNVQEEVQEAQAAMRAFTLKVTTGQGEVDAQ